MKLLNQLLGGLIGVLLYPFMSILLNGFFGLIGLGLKTFEFIANNGPLGLLFSPFLVVILGVVGLFFGIKDVFTSIGTAIKVATDEGVVGIFTGLGDSNILSELSFIWRIMVNWVDSKEQKEPPAQAQASIAVSTSPQARLIPTPKPQATKPFDLTGYVTETKTHRTRDNYDAVIDRHLSEILADKQTETLYITLQKLHYKLKLHDSGTIYTAYISPEKPDGLLHLEYEQDGKMHVVPESTQVIKSTELVLVDGNIAYKPKQPPEPYEGKPTTYQLYRFFQDSYCHEYNELSKQIVEIIRDKKQAARTKEHQELMDNLQNMQRKGGPKGAGNSDLGIFSSTASPSTSTSTSDCDSDSGYDSDHPNPFRDMDL